jgi:hypothetical protein
LPQDRAARPNSCGGGAAAGTAELSSTLAVAVAMAAPAHRVIQCLRRASPRRDKRSLILLFPVPSAAPLLGTRGVPGVQHDDAQLARQYARWNGILKGD